VTLASSARARTAPDPATSASASERYALCVADLTIAVESRSPSLGLQTSGTARLFLADGREPDLRLRALWRPLDADPGGELVFDSGGTWRLYAREGRDVYRFFDPRLGPAPYKEAEIGPGDEGLVFLNPAFHAPGEPVDALQFPLDELLFLRLLSARGGIELHACGVVAPSGQGLVLAGQSGDGKTTTARLWESLPGATVLSDDRIVLRPAGGGRWWMYGTPWHGEAELASPRRAPVAAILLLARGERNALLPLAPAEAASALLARAFVPFHDASRMAATLECLDGLTQAVRCFRFPFVPGAEAVPFALDAVR
jgi:hypothetical protein